MIFRNICLIQNLNEKSGELIAGGASGKFDSTLDALEVAQSLNELKTHIKASLSSHKFNSQIKTDVKLLEQ